MVTVIPGNRQKVVDFSCNKADWGWVFRKTHLPVKKDSEAQGDTVGGGGGTFYRLDKRVPGPLWPEVMLSWSWRMGWLPPLGQLLAFPWLYDCLVSKGASITITALFFSLQRLQNWITRHPLTPPLFTQLWPLLNPSRTIYSQSDARRWISGASVGHILWVITYHL